jgi:hypothetical protein
MSIISSQKLYEDLKSKLDIKYILKHFHFLPFFLSYLVYCWLPLLLENIFAEKYETKIMRKEMLMGPNLCFIFHFV